MRCSLTAKPTVTKGEMTGAVEGNTHITSNKIPSSSPTVVSIGWQETCASLQVV